MAETQGGVGVGAAVEKLAERLQGARTTRRGEVVFVTTGADSGQYSIDVGPGGATVSSGRRMGSGTPLVEIMGDAETVRAVLEGERDAREQFLEGGLRLRGDLRYVSDVAMELGILKHPL